MSKDSSGYSRKEQWLLQMELESEMKKISKEQEMKKRK